MRDVFLGKNIVSFAFALFEVFLIAAVIVFVAQVPPVSILVATLLWAVGSLLLCTAVGNLRSVSSPKRIDTGRMSGKQVGQASALLLLAVLLGCIGLGVALWMLSAALGAFWILWPAMAVYCGVSLWIYTMNLRGMDLYVLPRREAMLEALARP